MSKTMTDRKLLTILLGALLGICMVMSIGVQNAYADSLDDEETIGYDAIFVGEASLIADEWGDLYLDSDVIEDCSVTIQTAGAAGEDLNCDFKYDEEEGDIIQDQYGNSYGYYFYCENEYEYKNGLNKVYLHINGFTYKNDDESYNWYAIAEIENAEVYNEVTSISYRTSSTSVYSEDIKYTDEYGEGTSYLNIDARSVHSQGGETWRSPFAVGDELTVHYSNGLSKTFINKDYYDMDCEEYKDRFFCGDEEISSIWMEFEQEEPKAGNNIVWVYSYGRRASFNLKLETPESRAAEEKARKEAEAKAKAEAEAKAKAEAEARAKASNINKGTVTATDIKKASALGVTTVTLGPKVKKLKKNAFKGAKITTIVVKTKKLKKGSVKGSLKGSKVKTVKVQIGSKKVNKKFVKKYKKIFTKKIAGKKVRVK